MKKPIRLAAVLLYLSTCLHASRLGYTSRRNSIFWKYLGKPYENDENCGPDVPPFICAIYIDIRNQITELLPLQLGNHIFNFDNEVIWGQLQLQGLKFENFANAKLTEFTMNPGNFPTLAITMAIEIDQLDFEAEECSGELILFNAILVECSGILGATFTNFNIKELKFNFLFLTEPESCLTISDTHIEAITPKIKVSIGDLHEQPCINDIANYEISESLTALMADKSDIINKQLNELLKYITEDLIAPLKCDEIQGNSEMTTHFHNIIKDIIRKQQIGQV